MLCKCHWIMLYTVHFTAFSLGGRFFRTRCIYNECILYHEIRNISFTTRHDKKSYLEKGIWWTLLLTLMHRQTTEEIYGVLEVDEHVWNIHIRIRLRLSLALTLTRFGIRILSAWTHFQDLPTIKLLLLTLQLRFVFELRLQCRLWLWQWRIAWVACGYALITFRTYDIRWTVRYLISVLADWRICNGYRCVMWIIVCRRL